jgi:DNA-binding MarR family transcriptional regulator
MIKHFRLQTMTVEGEATVADVDCALGELMRIMPRVLRGLRRGSACRQDGGGANGTTAGLRELLASGGLGPRHIPVLVALAADGQMSVGDLAHRVGLTLATVSLMVGELARVGLVDRREDERDRRRTLVSVAEQHRVPLAWLVSERTEPLRRALSRMSPEIRHAFVTGWRLLADEIEPTDEPAVSRA